MKNEKVISEEVYNNILDYYEKKEVYNLGLITEAKETLADVIKENKVKVPEKKPKEKKKINLTVLLSIIASCFIGGGIISLIGYNWNAIPRTAKSIAAVIICFAAPILYTLLTYLRKKPFEKRSKEFFAALWDILFGASIAFISQIYRMPSNPISFLIVWIIVSIGIMYALKSHFAYGFSLLLVIIYSIYSQQFAYSTAVAFYPAMFLIYFFARENKKCFYIWLIELIALVSVVFEKSLPGLWIIAYVSINVLLLAYAEKTQDKFCRYAGYVQAAVLLVILAIPYFWEDIGFGYFRDDPKYNRYGSICDYIVTVGLYLGSFAVIIPSLINKIKNKIAEGYNTLLAELVFLVVIGASYLCGCLIEGFAIYITRVFMAVYLAILFYLIFHSETKKVWLLFSPVFYVALLGQINFITVIVLTLIIAINAIIEKQKQNKSLNIFMLSLPAYIIFAERIYFAFTESLFNIIPAKEECKLVDLIVISVNLLAILTYVIYKNLKLKAINKENFITKLSFYVSIILFSLIVIFAEYKPSCIETLFNISIIYIAIASAVDFFLNKTKHNYFGLLAFLINYFIFTKDTATYIFVFAILLIVLFAVRYYANESLVTVNGFNYIYSSLYLVTFLIAYILNFGNAFINENYNPFANVMSVLMYLTTLLVYIGIPVAGFIKENIKINISLSAISVIALLFMTTEAFLSMINPESMIYVICVSTILVSCLDILLFKRKENIIVLLGAVLIYFFQMTEGNNYFNGLALSIFVIFAFYYYSKYFTDDTNTLKLSSMILFGLVLFSMVIVNNNGNIKNNTLTGPFASVGNIVKTAVMMFALFSVPVHSIIKKHEIPSISAVVITFVTLLYYLLADYVPLFKLEYYLPILCILTVITGFIDVFILREEKNIFLMFIAAFELIAIINKNATDISIIMTIALCIFALQMYPKILSKESSVINKIITFIFSLFLLVSMVFEPSIYKIRIYNLPLHIISLVIVTIIMFAVPIYYVMKRRYKINYAVAFFCALQIITFVVSHLDINMSVYESIYNVLILLTILAFSIIGLIYAYEKASLKSANYYLFFLVLCFVIRFFMMSNGLIERGVVCIISGICILVMNLVFSKKMKHVEAKGEITNEK